MIAEKTVCEAIEALNSDVNRRIADAKAPLQMTPEQRDIVLVYAETNASSPGAPGVEPTRQELGRVQAIYVAGLLSMFDGPRGMNPFRDPGLAHEYDRQQQEIASQQDKSRGRDRTTEI